ncbi:hypothetical protein BRC71_02310 [Halobacteriales archaeon QH_7_65_31]|nr:MAG: hypothetical protein BRC71_02310 [Halobacteriales archaeon QH_7_65_31]
MRTLAMVCLVLLAGCVGGPIPDGSPGGASETLTQTALSGSQPAAPPLPDISLTVTATATNGTVVTETSY